MSPVELPAIVAISEYAIFKQTQKHESVGRGRYKLATIYGIVGLCLGGFSRPDGVAE